MQPAQQASQNESAEDKENWIIPGFVGSHNVW